MGGREQGDVSERICGHCFPVGSAGLHLCLLHHIWCELAVNKLISAVRPPPPTRITQGQGAGLSHHCLHKASGTLASPWVGPHP